MGLLALKPRRFKGYSLFPNPHAIIQPLPFTLLSYCFRGKGGVVFPLQ